MINIYVILLIFFSISNFINIGNCQTLSLTPQKTDNRYVEQTGSSFGILCSDPMQEQQGGNIYKFATWYSRDQPVAESNAMPSAGIVQIWKQQEKGRLLAFGQFSGDQAGEYYCRGSGSDGVEKTLRVQVLAYKPIQYKQPVNDKDPQFAFLGGDFTIKCVVSSEPASTISYTYSRSDSSNVDRLIFEQVKLDRRVTVVEDGLRIKEVRNSDAGWYDCIASQQQSLRFKHRYIRLVISSHPRITYLNTTGGPVDYNVPVKGLPIKLTCLSEGTNLEFIWYKDYPNNVITDKSDEERIKILPSTEAEKNDPHRNYSTISFREVESIDSGRYYCSVKNRHVISSASDRKSFVFKVWVRPQFGDNPKENRLQFIKNLGDELTIVCEAKFGTKPFDMWFEYVPWWWVPRWDYKHYYNITKMGPGFKEGNFSVRREETGQSSRLIMTYGHLEEKDSGNYTCIAENAGGNGTQNVSISAQFAPYFKPENQMYRAFGWPGKWTNLTCNVTAEPAPNKWTWQANNIDISPEQPNFRLYTQSGIRNTTLEIRMPDLYILGEIDPHFGTRYDTDYQCVAENTIGVERHRVRLVAGRPPGQPTSLSIIAANSSTTSLFIKVGIPSFSDGPPITEAGVRYSRSKEASFSAWFRSPMIDLKDPNILTERVIPLTRPYEYIRINNLRAKTEYLIQGCVINAVGIGAHSSISYTTPSPGKPLPVRILSSDNGTEPYQYQVFWSMDTTGGSLINGYKISYNKVKLASDSYPWSLSGSSDIGDGQSRVIAPKPNYLMLCELDADSFYKVSIIAINKEGDSKPAELIFKTAPLQPPSHRFSVPSAHSSYSGCPPTQSLAAAKARRETSGVAGVHSLHHQLTIVRTFTVLLFLFTGALTRTVDHFEHTH